MSGPCLALQSVSVGYGGPAVLRDVSLEVHPGEVVALLGANGVGKTTTLRTLFGLLKPTSGRASALGAGVDARRPHRNTRRGLTYVPEGRALVPTLTAAENLHLAGRHHAKRRARDLVPFDELQPLMNRRTALLSGGEQQMLAISCAMAARPAALMVDELSLGLAPIIVKRLLPVVRTFASELGAAVLIVEQHLHVALDVADRAYVLRGGQIVLEGSSAELRARDADIRRIYLGE